MSTNDKSDAQAAKVKGRELKTGKEIAEEDAAGCPGLLSVGREGEIDSGPETQMAPGILDSGTF